MANLKIIVYGHLRHPDYPWSVGKVKRLKVMPASDASLDYAENFVAAVRKRSDEKPKKRLLSHWRMGV